MPTDLPHRPEIGAPSWRAIGRGYLALAVAKYRIWRLKRIVRAGERIRRKIEGR